MGKESLVKFLFDLYWARLIAPCSTSLSHNIVCFQSPSRILRQIRIKRYFSVLKYTDHEGSSEPKMPLFFPLFYDRRIVFKHCRSDIGCSYLYHEHITPTWYAYLGNPTSVLPKVCESFLECYGTNRSEDTIYQGSIFADFSRDRKMKSMIIDRAEPRKKSRSVLILLVQSIVSHKGS